MAVLLSATNTYEIPALIPIDAVLVLDVSNSMRTADPNRISRDAMNMFIDMLEDDRDRVGLVSYAGLVEYSRPLVVINGTEDRVSLTNSIYNMYYASWTDHGIGLLEAVHIMVDDFEYDRQQVIIFFTDGNLNVNPWGERTAQNAKDDIALALETAQQYGFPVYTIGLNFDGALDRASIDEMADATGGIAFETANAEDLPQIMAAIFAMMQPSILLVAEEDLQAITEIEKTLVAEEIPVQPEIYEPEIFTYEEILNEDYPPNRIWLFFAIIGIAAGMIAYVKIRNPKRVFTGKMLLEVGNGHTHKPLLTRNLIEYGRRTTLQRLIGEEVDSALAMVTIIPHPQAPSHLPQLLIKCKHPQVKFFKDFIAQDTAIGLSLGAEVMVSFEGIQVRLRYEI